MKNLMYLLAILLVGSCVTAFAQAEKPEEPRSISQVLDRAVGGIEGEFVSAAEAMPEDKYSFAPATGEFKGVRTFSQQIKHVAAVNYLVAASILGEKPPLDIGGENGPNSITSKTDIIKFLKDSYAYSHRAASSVNDKNLIDPIPSPFGQGKTTRLGLSELIVAHGFDHYGQMVVYLRMNGIIPPASR